MIPVDERLPHYSAINPEAHPYHYWLSVCRYEADEARRLLLLANAGMDSDGAPLDDEATTNQEDDEGMWV